MSHVLALERICTKGPYPSPIERPRAAETALVVVPDPGERTAATVQLRGIGHHLVLSLGSAAEAVPHLHEAGTLCMAAVDRPGGPGMELLARARAIGWPTVALAARARPETARAAMAKGIGAYVAHYANTPTAYDPSHSEVSRATASGPQSALSHPEAAPAGCRALTAREIEILGLVAQGKTNRTIAQSARISPLTVKSHLTRIARILGTGNRSGMVAIALRAGLIP